jgi:serine/threonine protein kinase
MDMSRRRNTDRHMTLAVNMRNFKNLKHVDDIDSIYNRSSVLGKGSFGEVWRARRKGADFDCAMKIIKKASLANNPMLP